MISRIWHGYTRPGDADAYEALLRDEIITGIENRSIDGFREIQLLRRDLGDEVEFITVMWFDSMDGVRVSVESSSRLIRLTSGGFLRSPYVPSMPYFAACGRSDTRRPSAKIACSRTRWPAIRRLEVIERA